MHTLLTILMLFTGNFVFWVGVLALLGGVALPANISFLISITCLILGFLMLHYPQP
jgi:membrane protein implicated in regulation of membrane protease activity